MTAGQAALPYSLSFLNNMTYDSCFVVKRERAIDTDVDRVMKFLSFVVCLGWMLRVFLEWFRGLGCLFLLGCFFLSWYSSSTFLFQYKLGYKPLIKKDVDRVIPSTTRTNGKNTPLVCDHGAPSPSG